MNESLSPNTRDIEDHIRAVSRGAASVVVAFLKPDASKGRAMQAFRVRLDSATLVAKIVERNLKGENAYFCSGNVAPHWRPPNPPTKEQIESNSYLHADIDFRAPAKPGEPGEPADEGRSRVLRDMRALVDRNVLPEPSHTVFTGGGSSTRTAS